MAALALTRAQIIEEGLSQAGRADLTANARLWLNLILEEIYLTQDFDWLVKTNSAFAVTQGASLPTDYRSAKSAVIVHSNGSEAPLEILSNAAEYDFKRLNHSESTEEGQPRYVYANHDTRVFYFLPAPDQTYTMNLKYFYLPTIPTHVGSSGDADTVKWGLPYRILIDAIKTMAFEYNDDTRAEAAAQSVVARIAAAKMNNHDRRAGKSKFAMGKSFRKRF